MAVSLGDIVVRFLADTTELVAGVEESKGLLGNFGGIAAGVGVAAGAALVGIGVESVKMAGEFQQSLTQLVTGAGESQKNLGMVGDGIKQISVESATSTKALTEGMYMIESAGFHGAAGLDVLKASAEGARAGNANLATAANAVTTMMVDYSAKHYTATEAMNALIATEQVGKTHLEDLGRSMGAVLPLASSLGVSFPQVAGGIAVMTNAGMTAQHASQNLANALRNLAAPSGKASNELDYLGLTAQKVKDTLGTQGLGAALQLIEDHVAKKFPAGSSQAVAAFKTIMGGATGYNVALMLGGEHMKTYEANVKSIGAALSKNASDVEGFSLVQQSFAFQLDKAKMAGNALMITLGQALLPVLTNLLQQITPMITNFTTWETKTHGVEKAISLVSTVVGTVVTKTGELVSTISRVVTFFQQNQVAADLLAGALAGVTVAILAANAGAIIAAVTAIPAVVVGFGAWAVAAGAAAIATLAAAAPFILIGIAVALVVAGIILAIQHWGEITKFLQGVWAAFSSWFMGALGAVGGFFHSVWDGITAFFAGVWKGIIETVKGAVGAVVGWFVWLYEHNYYFQALVDFIMHIITGIKQWLGDTWKNIVTAIEVTWNYLSSAAHYYWDLLSHDIQVIINKLSAWFTTTWQNITKPVVDAWSTISGIIGGAWNTYIAGPIGKLWGKISDWFTGIAKSAGTWGKNLIQGFIDGITGMLGNVGTAASNVVATVGKFLGFHSPTELGPGREADQWAPNLVKMYAGGLASGVPQIASASSALIAPVGMRLNTATPNPRGQLNTAPSPLSRSQTAHIHVYLGGKEIVSQLMPMVYDEARAMTGWRPVG